MFKVVQRAMSALGADLDRDTCAVDIASRKYWGIQPQSTPCKDLPPDSHHIRLNTGMGSETWQQEVSRIQIPSNGLRMVVEKRDPAEQLASAYCYHSSGHENGTWGFSDKYPKIPYDHLAEMDLRDGVAAVAGQVYAELDQTVSLLSVPGLHPLEVRYENFVRSSHDFDRQAFLGLIGFIGFIGFRVYGAIGLIGPIGFGCLGFIGFIVLCWLWEMLLPTEHDKPHFTGEDLKPGSA